MHWPRSVPIGMQRGEIPLENTVGYGQVALFAQERAGMVREQLAGRDITDARVLAAMATVPREEFVPEDLRAMAYADRPLPIGYGQTISQPYIVAYLLQVVKVWKGARVLDVGTGSGYQAAVLAAMGAEVFGVEIVRELAEQAARHPRLAGVTLSHRDGSEGWAEHAPYDAIVIAAAAPMLPRRLRTQIAVGGRLVMPVGGRDIQHVLLVSRIGPEDFREQSLLSVCFVPMTGGVQQ